MDDAETKIVRGLADNREIKAPFAEDSLRFCFLFRLQHHEHALLAFRKHHFIGGHVLFANGNMVENEFDAEIALGTHLDRRAGEAGSAHVLNGDDRTGSHEFKAGFKQAFFGERIAHLNGGALFLDRLVEFSRCHCCAANTIAASLCTQIDDRQADALGFRQENAIMPGKTGSKGIDEDIAVIALVEIHLATDSRHAEGIAIAADAGNNARDEVAGF